MGWTTGIKHNRFDIRLSSYSICERVLISPLLHLRIFIILLVNIWVRAPRSRFSCVLYLISTKCTQRDTFYFDFAYVFGNFLGTLLFQLPDCHILAWYSRTIAPRRILLYCVRFFDDVDGPHRALFVRFNTRTISIVTGIFVMIWVCVWVFVGGDVCCV